MGGWCGRWCGSTGRGYIVFPLPASSHSSRGKVGESITLSWEINQRKKSLKRRKERTLKMGGWCGYWCGSTGRGYIVFPLHASSRSCEGEEACNGNRVDFLLNRGVATINATLQLLDTYRWLILFFYEIVYILLTIVFMHYIFLISFGIIKILCFKVIVQILILLKRLLW